MVIMPADCHVSLSLCSTDFVGSCLKIGLPSPDTEHTVRVKEHSECAQACVCIAKWFRALQSAPDNIVLLPSLLLLQCSTRAPVLSFSLRFLIVFQLFLFSFSCTLLELLSPCAHVFPSRGRHSPPLYTLFLPLLPLLVAPREKSNLSRVLWFLRASWQTQTPECQLLGAIAKVVPHLALPHSAISSVRGKPSRDFCLAFVYSTFPFPIESHLSFHS